MTGMTLTDHPRSTSDLIPRRNRSKRVCPLEYVRSRDLFIVGTWYKDYASEHSNPMSDGGEQSVEAEASQQVLSEQ